MELSQAEVEDLSRLMTMKLIETFPHPQQKGKTSIPILPSIGNNDIYPHNDLEYDRARPNRNLDFFADLWEPFIPSDQQDVFRRLGSFYTELVPGRLWGVSLNTLYFTNRNRAIDDCLKMNSLKKKKKKHRNGPSAGNDVLDWLEHSVLIPARAKGVHVYLSGHIPPNVAEYLEGCYKEFSKLTLKYADVVIAQYYGHMNIDHFFFTTPNQQLKRKAMNRRHPAQSLPETDLQTFMDDDVGDSIPKWLYIYFDNLISHFGKIKHHDIVPHPVFVSPSIIPVFNPGLRVYLYHAEEGSEAEFNYGAVLDYEQYFADLDDWNSRYNRLHSNGIEDSWDPSDFKFTLEYTPKERYNMDYDTSSKDAWMDLASRMSGLDYSIFRRRKGRKKKQRLLDEYATELRKLFFTHMVVKLHGFAFGDD